MNASFAQMRRVHHCTQGRLDRAAGIGQEIGDAGQGFVGCVANFQRVKGRRISGRNYAASSAKTMNGEQLSFANCLLRIICATSIPAIVAAAE